MLFGCEQCDTAKYEIFAIAALLGAGGSAMLINCLAIVANLIASNIGTYFAIQIQIFILYAMISCFQFLRLNSLNICRGRWICLRCYELC